MLEWICYVRLEDSLYDYVPEEDPDIPLVIKAISMC